MFSLVGGRRRKSAIRRKSRKTRGSRRGGSKTFSLFGSKIFGGKRRKSRKPSRKSRKLRHSRKH